MQQQYLVLKLFHKTIMYTYIYPLDYDLLPNIVIIFKESFSQLPCYNYFIEDVTILRTYLVDYIFD